jgi:hypothetical protein
MKSNLFIGTRSHRFPNTMVYVWILQKAPTMLNVNKDSKVVLDIGDKIQTLSSRS